MANDVFIALELTTGERAKLTRIANNWRQIDLAARAGVQITDVIALEKDRWLPSRRREKLLAALGLKSNED